MTKKLKLKNGLCATIRRLVVPRQSRNKPLKMLETMLAADFRNALGYAAFIVHQNSCHAYGELTYHVICTALVNRRKPSVQAVLCGPNERIRKW